MRNIPYASTPADEPKEIVINPEYFKTLLPLLDLQRNFKAYVMVPELDRYEINNIVARRGFDTTKPSKLLVKLGTKSAWDKEGKYTSKYFNFLQQTDNEENEARHYENVRQQLGIDEEAGSDGVMEAAYEMGIEYVPGTNYTSVIKWYKQQFGIDYLKPSDSSLLLKDGTPFIDFKPRPMAYKVSAVYEKGTRAYILVLDTVLDQFIGVQGKSDFVDIPTLKMSLSEFTSKYDDKVKKENIWSILFLLEAKFGWGTVEEIISMLNDGSFNKDIVPHILREGKELIPRGRSDDLTGIKAVYSKTKEPKYVTDLTFDKTEHEFAIGHWGELPIFLPRSENTIDSLLQKVEIDPEIYRIFSHNAYIPTKKKNPYITDDTVKLYIKDFYHFHDGKSFPIREIKRQKQWEPASPPDIPAKYLAMEGNPVEIAIQCYLETGVGISYWNFRAATRK